MELKEYLNSNGAGPFRTADPFRTASQKETNLSQ